MGVSKKPTVVDIFCGCGGFSEGFRQAGFDIKLGIDMDKYSIATYNRNHNNKGKIANVIKVNSSVILESIGEEQVDVLIGGPPCQAFSSVALAKWRALGRPGTIHHPLNKLYKELLRLIKEVNPKIFVIENVEGMINIRNGIVKETIQSSLGKTYNISFYVKNAMNFGVPQNRKRVIIIGNKLDHDNPILQETHVENNLTKEPIITVSEAISDLPKVRHSEGKEYYPYGPESRASKYALERRRKSNGIYNHLSRGHSERDLAIFRLLSPGQSTAQMPELNPYRKDIFRDKYRKQPWNEPSSTILAHLSKDGLMFIHPDEHQNRTLTPREAARLQSFDDSYIFEGPKTYQFKQIGNAVPPIFTKFIAKKLIAILREEKHQAQLIKVSTR